MSCYFVIDTYIDEIRGRGMYDDYIEKVKPIVEKYEDIGDSESFSASAAAIIVFIHYCLLPIPFDKSAFVKQLGEVGCILSKRKQIR